MDLPMDSKTIMRNYRLNNPEYYAKELLKNAERNLKAYQENTERRDKVLTHMRTKRLDPEYRAKEAAYSRAAYQRKKALIAAGAEKN